MRSFFDPKHHDLIRSGALPRCRLIAFVSLFGLAGCAAIQAPVPTDPPASIVLYQPASTATALQFHRDRVDCGAAMPDQLGSCLADRGHARATKSAAETVVDNAYFGSVEPQSLAFTMLGSTGFYTGATELFPHTAASAVVLNRVEGPGRCDGTARLVHSAASGHRLGGTGMLQCDGRSVITLRLTLDTPNSGHGVGKDAAGNTFAILFGPPPLAAKENHQAVRQILAAALPPNVSDATPAPTAIAVRRQFLADDFVLNRVRNGARSVPHRYLTSLPAGLADDGQIQRRKDLFIKVVLPLVLLSNDATLADRRHMLQLISRLDKGQPISTTNQLWLNRLAHRYETTPDDFATLRYRIDAIPPSLAIAQAALETGWGTSRFANQGNALFGEWTFGDRRGIVPASRGLEKDHKIRSFDNLLHSVLAYSDNLNSHPAYRDMRAKRASKRAYGSDMNSFELAEYLDAYGQDSAYVTKVKQVIRANRLRALDDADLENVPVFAPPSPREHPLRAAVSRPRDQLGI